MNLFNGRQEQGNDRASLLQQFTSSSQQRTPVIGRISIKYLGGLRDPFGCVARVRSIVTRAQGIGSRVEKMNEHFALPCGRGGTSHLRHTMI